MIWGGSHPHPPDAQCDWLAAAPSCQVLPASLPLASVYYQRLTLVVNTLEKSGDQVLLRITATNSTAVIPRLLIDLDRSEHHACSLMSNPVGPSCLLTLNLAIMSLRLSCARVRVRIRQQHSAGTQCRQLPAASNRPG